MIKRIALCFLVLVVLTALLPVGYEHQFRDSPNAGPSKQFPLGTDDLGRDRFSRLIYGTRVSLLLATAAAVCHASQRRFWEDWQDSGIADKLILGAMDLFLSLPWLFLIADGKGFFAPQCLADIVGNHHILIARDAGMGDAGKGRQSGGAKALGSRISCCKRGQRDAPGWCGNI